jgi:hypothetical protein
MCSDVRRRLTAVASLPTNNTLEAQICMELIDRIIRSIKLNVF